MELLEHWSDGIQVQGFQVSYDLFCDLPERKSAHLWVAWRGNLSKERALAIEEDSDAFEIRHMRREFRAIALNLFQLFLPLGLMKLEFAQNKLVKRERSSHVR